MQRICTVCSQPFEVIGRQLRCSIRCRNAHIKKVSRARYANCRHVVDPDVFDPGEKQKRLRAATEKFLKLLRAESELSKKNGYAGF
jgi:hypothetical protein